MELKQNYEIDKDSHYKPKKYVFKIYPENIDYIEKLDMTQRAEFINQAIETHVGQYNKERKQTEFLEQLKSFLLYGIIILLLLPFIVYFVKFASTHSGDTNKQMEYNFERLFDKYNIK